MIKEKCGNNIESIINPESVAVVEATSRLEPIGLTIFKNLLQTGCRVFNRVIIIGLGSVFCF